MIKKKFKIAADIMIAAQIKSWAAKLRTQSPIHMKKRTISIAVKKVFMMILNEDIPWLFLVALEKN